MFLLPQTIAKKNNNELLSIMRGPGDSTHPPPSKSEVTSSTKQTHFPPQSYREPPAEPSPDNDLSYDLTQEKKSTKKKKKTRTTSKIQPKKRPKTFKKKKKNHLFSLINPRYLRGIRHSPKKYPPKEGT